MKELVETLRRLHDDKPYEMGWYLKDLITEETAENRGDVIVPSASTRKISIMMAVLRHVKEGRLALDQPITIEAKYQDGGGIMQHADPGATLTLRDAILLNIIVSDTACTGILVDLVGLDTINTLCHAIGMKGTTHRHGIPALAFPKGMAIDHPADATNATTPRDLGILLETILQGTRDREAADRLGCTPFLCQLAMDIMGLQKLRTKLPYLLPHGTHVAHKTGTGARTVADAGIVFDANKQPLFILTAIADGVPREDVVDKIPGFSDAERLIARMSRTCYDHLTMRNGARHESMG